MKRAEVMIFGQVQGIGFRYFVKEKADEFKIVGFVQNQPDNSVLIVAEAEKDELEKFIQSVKIEHRFAKITNLNIEWFEAKNEYNKFDIR